MGKKLIIIVVGLVLVAVLLPFGVAMAKSTYEDPFAGKYVVALPDANRGDCSSIATPVISADLVKRGAWSEHQHFDISKDEDSLQTLYGLVRNTGTAGITARVEFNIYDKEGQRVATVISDPVTLDSGDEAVVSGDWLALVGKKYSVTAQAKWDGGTGTKIKTFGFTARWWPKKSEDPSVSVHNVITAGPGTGCAACHNTAIPVADYTGCTSCHDGTDGTTSPVYPVLGGMKNFTVHHGVPLTGTLSCLDAVCHDTNDARYAFRPVLGSKANGHGYCGQAGSCHGAGGDDWTTKGGSCQKSNCHI